jgi:hypothetical protein
MNRAKSTYLILLFVLPVLIISAEKSNTSDAPTGYTGENPNQTCRNCHQGNPLNASGGLVTINNLPPTYTPGTKYDFSVTINHSQSNRTKWGFAIKAVSAGKAIGTFTENNSNAVVNSIDGEIGHLSAPSTPSSSTYTFDNLSWTAPSNPGTSDNNITFYVVGNAANGFGSSGDFIYTANKTLSLFPTSISESSLLAESLKIATSGKSILINLQLSKASSLQPIIYDLSGKELLKLPLKKYNSGKHNIDIDGSHLPNGSYIFAILNDKKSVSRKFVL